MASPLCRTCPHSGTRAEVVETAKLLPNLFGALSSILNLMMAHAFWERRAPVRHPVLIEMNELVLGTWASCPLGFLTVSHAWERSTWERSTWERGRLVRPYCIRTSRPHFK